MESTSFRLETHFTVQYIPVQPSLWPFDAANCKKPLLPSLEKLLYAMEIPEGERMVWHKNRVSAGFRSRDSEPPTRCPANGRTAPSSNHQIQAVVPNCEEVSFTYTHSYLQFNSIPGDIYKAEANPQETFHSV